MLDEITEQGHANYNGSPRTRHLFSLFIALLFTLTIHTTNAQAQIVGDIEATIPFQFRAGDTKLPTGKYSIHPLDNPDLTVMEISGEDGSISALFEVSDAQASSAPAKTELIFNKYGDRYFLAQVFDESSRIGSAVSESRYEKKLSQAATEAQAHVPAHHKGQQGG